MKFVNDRKELAIDINVNMIPVLTMDISRPMNGDDFYKDCYEGSKVRVARASSNIRNAYSRCTMKMFGDESGNENHEEPWKYKKIVLSCPCVGLKADFNLNDAREMVEWSNTKLLTTGDEVYVFFDRGDKGYFRKMKVSSVNPGCSDVAYLEDID